MRDILKTNVSRRAVLGAGVAGASLLAMPSLARAQGAPIRLGTLTPLTGAGHAMPTHAVTPPAGGDAAAPAAPADPAAPAAPADPAAPAAPADPAAPAAAADPAAPAAPADPAAAPEKKE